jgi:hypothetical protein
MLRLGRLARGPAPDRVMPKRCTSAAARGLPKPVRFRLRLLVGLALGLSMCFSAAAARAAPGEAEARQGLALANKGKCDEAIPLLEIAEERRHRPHTALVLADCYVKKGDLLQASAVYGAIAEEPPDRSHGAPDRAAIKSAKKKAADVEARIPTLAFSIPAGQEGTSITVDGDAVESPGEPQKFDPGREIVVVVKARGHADRTDKIKLEEREHRVFEASIVPPRVEAPKQKAGPTNEPRNWVGASVRGYLIPRFAMNIFAEGGRTTYAPGGALTFTRPSGQLDVVVTLGYVAFFLQDTPFKPNGAPDTEYELVRSSMGALQASFEVFWNVPLDQKKRFRFRIGAGFGLGSTFHGELYRRQSYPAGLTPSDPYTYLPCLGPNNPTGTFRYCNELDKDAKHYGAYAEPSWFSGGVRPLVYPWVALPIAGLSFRPTPRVSIDLDVAPTLSGILTSLGVRYGLF